MNGPKENTVSCWLKIFLSYKHLILSRHLGPTNLSLMFKPSMVFLLILVVGVFIRYNHGTPRKYLIETEDTEDTQDNTDGEGKYDKYESQDEFLFLEIAWKLSCQYIVQ